MKKRIRKLTLGVLLSAVMLNFAACGGVDVAYGTVTRDSANVGGANLTFDYNEKSHVATFGGEGETISYYAADSNENFDVAGNRVGITITLPADVEDFSKARLKIGTSEIKDGNFIEEDAESINVYPIVSESAKEIKIYIKWSDSTNEQIYTVKIASGTEFESATA